MLLSDPYGALSHFEGLQPEIKMDLCAQPWKIRFLGALAGSAWRRDHTLYRLEEADLVLLVRRLRDRHEIVAHGAVGNQECARACRPHRGMDAQWTALPKLAPPSQAGGRIEVLRCSRP